MSEIKKKVEVKLTPKMFSVLNILGCCLIILTNVLRYFVKNNSKKGIDGTPVMLFMIQTILTILHALLIFFGEINKPAFILYYYPLLVARFGRGVLLILVALPLLCPNFWIILLVIIITLIGALNIWMAWDDAPVTLNFDDEGFP